MSNFLKFIDDDIDAKKTLFSIMPTNNKKNVKKFNEKIASISEKYNEYRLAVKKYLDTKSRSFNIKNNDKNLDALNNKVSSLEHVRFVLNPTNTYLEKMGFDNLIYQISNYYDFNFNSLNDIINQFLDKFDMAEIRLAIDDFDYTVYVREYMTSFLEVRNGRNKNYDRVSETFERIYWINPDIIQHIELNFRKIIRKNEKKLINYIAKLQKEVMLENNINSYEDCLEKLKTAYIDLNNASHEDICDIINLAKNGAIDMNNYFADSKTRLGTYSALMIDSMNLEDKTIMDKFYENLEKLKHNIEEYSNYLKFMPLINNFKKEYEKQLSVSDKNSTASKNLKAIESEIIEKEGKLEKINKDVFRGEIGFFESRNNNNIKQLRLESVKQAKTLYDLYKAYDQEYFNDKVLSFLNISFTISELLHLYYSFDYFKKIAIKKTSEITTYDEIIKYSNEFDLFAMNPTNIIINGIALFEESNVARIIVNRYRLANINLTEDGLIADELPNLIDKIQLLLRVNEIEKSSTNVEKLWFMAQVEKISIAESKKN